MTPGDDLTEVRYRIDAVDRQLVLMLAQRQRLVEIAAVLKGSTTAVPDPVRERAVLNHVRVLASEAGLSEAIALPLWRNMIGHFTRHQIDWLANQAQQALAEGPERTEHRGPAAPTGTPRPDDRVQG